MTRGQSERRADLGDRSLQLVPTRLSQRLHEGSHPDIHRAFVLARKTFISSRRIDMGELSGELGVDRTSLFRWVGNRDALLAEVIWSLAVPTLNRADRDTAEQGARRVSALLTRFVEAMIEAQHFRDFLRREPARALRLLTTKESEAQRRYVAATESLVLEEESAGRLALTLPAHDLAYLLVRISESFTYADLITGEEPNAELARAAFELVLRVGEDDRLLGEQDRHPASGRPELRKGRP